MFIGIVYCLLHCESRTDRPLIPILDHLLLGIALLTLMVLD